VYPITVRLDKFIHQNLETPLHLYRGNRRLGIAKAHYCWQVTVKARRVRTNQSSSTSGHDHVDAGLHVGHIGNRSPSYVATVPLDAALPFPVNRELGRFKDVYFIIISRGGS